MSDRSAISVIRERADKATGMGGSYDVLEGKGNKPGIGLFGRIKNAFSMGRETPTFVKLPSGKVVPATARINSTLGQIASGGRSSIMKLEIDGEEVDANTYEKSAEGELQYATENEVVAAVEAGDLPEEALEIIKRGKGEWYGG